MILRHCASSRPTRKATDLSYAGNTGCPTSAARASARQPTCAMHVTKEACFGDLTVVAVCTGGAETNAGRAGDPASVYERDGLYEKVSAEEPVLRGTINTMLFISRELTPAALVDAVMTATEAKTAALQEINVGSRYSDGLATGTGTDQIGIAARLRTGRPLASAGNIRFLGSLSVRLSAARSKRLSYVRILLHRRAHGPACVFSSASARVSNA